ncbi:Pkinase-domain-containing protein [Neocallimastix californiae]|uniref:Pkinase-domain-containing protein n=1 Tax=Neocallimastix californiae TaxID=1754190 RepID=A0A1Y2FTR1_9FUNG|nr:Pkinase-domain-containing protein [Neocallimastix californiae]|eukprot:ORY86576.1 Pkinase-domain-containing protein [Neocallimastix californiae]
MSLQQIGRGGTSKVYKVLSQEGKILALKKIDINGSDKTAFQGYINEINLLNHLKNNSRIIQLMDSEINRDTNSIYMVMECGEIDLARLLQKEGNKISISSIKMYWEQMLKAVHAIHEENIIHSDLKPANFLLVGGALKLIDFGIAKAIPNDTTNIHRETQTGTVNYMSPESISDFNADVDSDQRPDFKISRASDVWSLGCILYQMVYGKPPFFRENTIFKKFKAIVNIKYQIAFSSDRNQFRLESSQNQSSSSSNSNENNGTYNINDFVSSPLIEVMKLCLQREPKKRPTIPQLLQQAFIHAPQVSYNLVYNIVDEMLNYCNKKDDVGKISQVLYEQILKQGSF